MTIMSSGRLNTSSQSSRPRRWAASDARAASVNGRPPPGDLLQSHREYDDEAEENRLDARIDAQEIHGVGEDEQKERRQRHHFDPADAALETHPRDHRRGDAFERQLRADHRLSRADLRSEPEPR